MWIWVSSGKVRRARTAFNLGRGRLLDDCACAAYGPTCRTGRIPLKVACATERASSTGMEETKRAERARTRRRVGRKFWYDAAHAGLPRSATPRADRGYSNANR